METPIFTQEIRLKERGFVLHPLSDVHIGASGHNKKALEQKVKMITDAPPNHRVLLLGDLADMAIIGSKGQKHGGISPQKELDMLVEVFKPIAERIDLIIPGNHEARMSKACGVSYTQMLAALLGVPDAYRPGATVIRYNMGENRSSTKMKKYGTYSVKIFAHHGYGGSRKAGGKINKLLDLKEMYSDSDVYLMGHVHDLISRVGTHTYGWPMKTKRQYFVVTGCYLGGEGVRMEGYAMNMGYSPSAVGTPVIVVAGAHGNTFKITVEIT